EQGAGSLAPLVQLQRQPVLVGRTVLQQGGQPVRTGATTQAGDGGAAGFGQLPGPGVGVRERVTGAQGGGQGGRQDLPQRRVGVARQPAQGVEQLALQQRLGVEQGQGLAQAVADLGRPD